MLRTRSLLALACLVLTGCPQAPSTPAGPPHDTESPKDSPVAYKVLEDKTENNSVEYHVLVDASMKHDPAQALLEYIYRRLWTARGDEPAGSAIYVYTSEAAYKTPPRTPIATCIRKSGEGGPTFENKVPLEFWQEIDEALKPDYDKKWKLARKVERDDPNFGLTLTLPHVEPDKDGKEGHWVDVLTFNQAMNQFTDTAQALFDKVPELKTLTYLATWKDKEVVRVQISRADYTSLQLAALEDRIGQHHGRVFLELASNRTSDAKAAKDNAGRIAKEYKTMLTQLKGKAKVDPSLK